METSLEIPPSVCLVQVAVTVVHQVRPSYMQSVEEMTEVERTLCSDRKAVSKADGSQPTITPAAGV